MKRRFLWLLTLLLLLGCTSQEAHLIYLEQATPAPTPVYTPTPAPAAEPITIDPIEGEGLKTDANGLPIMQPDTHYYDYYMTIDDLRIYEENGETLIDAVITNDYPYTLSGGLRVTFYVDGIKYGYADFYTEGDRLVLFSGRNRVYADVRTEIDVQMTDFEITVTVPFSEVVSATPVPEG
jgi:hypothetical protein